MSYHHLTISERENILLILKTMKMSRKLLKPSTGVRVVLVANSVETLKELICSGLKCLPCNTLTVDNSKEFTAHKATTTELKTQVYFAHPHSPWE